jgi:AraC-like DNA-binding protein
MLTINMPSARRVAKDILEALDNQIIPALQQQIIPIGCAALPFDFPPGINARLASKTVPRANTADIGFPLQQTWPRARLLSTFHPYFGIIYQGAANEHTVVTASLAAKHHISKGVYAIHWNAPSALLFPPGTARNDGTNATWDSTETKPPVIKIMWFDFLAPEILVHIHTENSGQPIIASHSLQIHNAALTALLGVLVEQSAKGFARDKSTFQTVLLAAMLRLKHYLETTPTQIANTSHPLTIPLNKELAVNDAWQQAMIFIQMHLHEPLTLRTIAREVKLSPTHLNRLFHQHGSVSVMRYVGQRRIEAAKKILLDGSENISEISKLLGFKRPNAFCAAFRQLTGTTPGQFRREAKR